MPLIRLSLRRRISILERALDEAFDGDRMCQVSFNVGDRTGMARDYVRSYTPPFPVADLLALPAIDPADISLGGLFENAATTSTLSQYNRTLMILTTRRNASARMVLWLVKLSGGTANQRFILARAKYLRSIDNVRFQLRV